ncbi:MAG: beta-lactamase family protein [Anaerolineae bacterium]|nr:beta-lactamase family protein [Anaerolineae bacterium]NUQ05136.1 serine hydrolase [Anaerolineae bacterium]
MGQRLERSAPEALGIPSRTIQTFIEAADSQIHELHSLMLMRHGSVAAEGWWSPYRAERPHMLFSLSKSFTSTAVGLAVAEGRLSPDDPVISFFPDQAPKTASDTLKAMQVRHLLSMSTGHIEDPTFLMRQRPDGDWISEFLERPIERVPGTHFVYNSGATFMLSAILQQITGMRLLDYLEPRLMQPLGITGATWELSPQGIHTGGWGLSITTEDIACFGQLYLQKGRWEGRQIVPEAWVREASLPQIANGSSPESDWEQGYGYQFWRCRHNSYRGDGAFGQFCVILSEQDAVLAITAGVAEMQPVLNLVWDILLPALNGEPLPPDPAAHEALHGTLSCLKLTPPQGEASSTLAAAISGRTYALAANERGFDALRFEAVDQDWEVTFLRGADAFPIRCGAGVWCEGASALLGFEGGVAASAVWSADDTLLLTMRFTDTPFFYTLPCRFAGDYLSIEGRVNVSFGPTRFDLLGRVR